LKKVILHIGYPKTGTTTLQESVFKNLHQAKLINYLGRSRNKINRFDGVDTAIQLRYFSLYNTRPIEISIEENEVNIISDENFLMLDLINKIQYHGENNWREVLNKVFSCLRDFDVEIIVTLRKQSDLIWSLYLQKFKYIYANNKKLEFKNFIEDTCFNMKSELDIYNFEILDGHLRQYTSSINYLFFEDLISDKAIFATQLSSIVGCKNHLLEPLLEKKYRLNTSYKKAEKVYEVSVKESIIPFVKFDYRPKGIMQRIKNKMFFDRIIKVSQPSKVLLEKLMSHYEVSNDKFFGKYEDLYLKAISYNYLRK
jgi:hypothetical protein